MTDEEPTCEGGVMLEAILSTLATKQEKATLYQERDIEGRKYVISCISTGWVIGDKLATKRAEDLLEKTVRIASQEFQEPARVEVNVRRYSNSTYTETVEFTYNTRLEWREGDEEKK